MKKVSIYKIKKAITNAGLNVLDARVAWWRSSNNGFKVTDWQSDAWLIEVRYSKGESEEAVQKCAKALNDAGINCTVYQFGQIGVAKTQ